MPTPRRDGADACPGALAMHQAADGALARVRLPAGRVSASQLRTLGGCAVSHGDGMVHLTSRANVQLRGLRADAEHAVVSRLRSGGLLPSPTHERVRNYLASPASGYFGGGHDVRPMIGALDEAVCSRPELAELPGRFLFALDDGRGDVVTSDADVCWQAPNATGEDSGRVLAGGVDIGLGVSSVDAVAALVGCAAEFGRRRGECWRVRELPGAVTLLRAAVQRELGAVPREGPAQAIRADGGEGAAHRTDSVGVFEQHDGCRTVVAATPFGELSARQVDALVAESDELVVTPWRTVIVPGIARTALDGVLRRLSAAGFGVDPSAGWLGVSACVGAPRCAKGNADVRSRAASVLPEVSAGTRVHFSGCERRCGRPVEPHTDVLATEHDYRVDGVVVPTESLLESLSVSRVEREQREGS